MVVGLALWVLVGVWTLILASGGVWCEGGGFGVGIVGKVRGEGQVGG